MRRFRHHLPVLFAVLAGGVLAAASSPFVPSQLPAGARLQLTALAREPLAQPARYEVIVIPGSGCAGLAPIAERYFRGLLHARLVVLQKPFVDAHAWPEPRCSRKFLQWDNLPAWRDAAATALRAWRASHPSDLPQLLVGISEGGEVIASLAPELPNLRGMVLIGSSGLDPAEVAQLQAARQGYSEAWRAVWLASASARKDSVVMEGRSLRYWRTLLTWQATQPLLRSPLPLLQAWGTADASVPQEAYRRFESAARQGRAGGASYCAMVFEGADHGLQRSGADGQQHDGLQDVWTRLENWARGAAWCAPATPSGVAQ